MSKLKTKKYNAVANAEKDASQTFVKGAAILTLSMVIVKVFGLLDKVILTGIFSGVSFEQAVAGGTETVNFASFGLGLYSNAYEIFVVIFTVATGGLPIAISRLVSESTAQKRFNDVKQIHRVSIPFFVIVGILSFAILVGASFIYVQIIESPYSLLGMLCLSPTVLFGCLVSIYRGYYEGQRNMFPTAVSEIIEATIKLFIGAFLAYIIAHLGMNSYAESGTVFGLYIANQTEAYQTIVSFSVAGAIMGITLGSAASFVFYILKFKIQGDGIPEEYYRNSVEARSKRETFNKILKTAIPVAMGSLIMSVGSLIDQVIVQRVLLNMIETNPQALQAQYSKYFTADMFYADTKTIHTSLWGCYSAALTFLQLVTAVTQVFGSSAMPNVTSAWTKGNKDELKKSIETVIRLTTIFGAASTPVCSMLQGIGRVDLPMKLYTVCMAVKIGITWMFVSVPEINVQGATVGSMITYAIMTIVGMYLLIKYSKIKPDLFGTTVKPLIGAIASAASAFGAYHLMESIIGSARMSIAVSLAVSIFVAVIVYIAVLLILRAFTATELKFLPKGEKIAKTLEKLGLIR